MSVGAPVGPIYAGSENVSQLLWVLHQWLGENQAFPAEIVRTKDERSWVGLNLGNLDSASVIKSFLSLWERSSPGFSEGVNGSLTIERKVPEGQRVELRKVIDSTWFYTDPQGRPAGNRGPIPRPDEQPQAYILGARDVAVAQRVLDLLLSALLPRLSVSTLAPESLDNSNGFKYLWWVDSSDRQVPLSILKEVPGAWRGPVLGQGSDLYLRWPWSLDISPKVLQRIYPHVANQIALLGPTVMTDPASGERPHGTDLLVLRGATLFSPLADHADFKIQHPSGRVSQVATEQPSVTFNVELRLRNRTGQSSDAARVAQLRLLIKTLRRELQALEEVHHEIDPSELGSEPLYIYVTHAQYGLGETPPIPTDLRRLLVAWSDQPADLGQLYYRRIRPEELPPDLLHFKEPAHVVVTSAALQIPGASGTTGLRLRRYAPTEGVNARFASLPEWRGFGLDVFVKDDKGLVFFPEMRPREITASKLAHALLPPGDQDPADWLILVTQVPGGGVRSWPLRKDGFRPLAESFEWDCPVDVSVPNPESDPFASRKEEFDNILVTFVETLFTSAQSRLVNDAIERRKQVLEREHKDLSDALIGSSSRREAALRNRVRTIQKDLEGLNSRAEHISLSRDSINDLSRSLDQLALKIDEQFRNLQRDGLDIQFLMKEIGEWVSDLAEARRRLAGQDDLPVSDGGLL